MYLMFSLLLISFTVAAQDEEAGEQARGFVLFGLSRLYDGAERVRGGVQQLLTGNQEILGGLVTLEQGLAGPISGGLTDMKTGIDNVMIPGLDDIRIGITGQVVPGLREMKSGIDGRVVPGLIELRDGLSDEMSPGLRKMRKGFTGTIIPGLGLIRGGLSNADPATPGVSQGLGSVIAYLGVADNAVTIVGGLTGIRNGLAGLVSPGLSSAITTIGAPTVPVAPSLTTSIQNDLEWAELHSTNPIAVQTAMEFAQPKLVAVSVGLTTARDAIDASMVPGLTLIITGIGVPVAPPFEGTTMIAVLQRMKGGIDGRMLPGLDAILEGLNDEVVPGLLEMRAGVNDKMIPGLNELIAGMQGDFSGGLGEMLHGFNRTEADHGQSGIVEGLTLIRGGLSSPVGEPGVSEGLGQVLGGIRGDVLGGVNQLQEGVAASVIPGLEEMHTGIQGELQPGFTTVSWLLLAIWLVSVLLFLAIGILIGRARRAKADAGHSTSL